MRSCWARVPSNKFESVETIPGTLGFMVREVSRTMRYRLLDRLDGAGVWALAAGQINTVAIKTARRRRQIWAERGKKLSFGGIMAESFTSAREPALFFSVVMLQIILEFGHGILDRDDEVAAISRHAANRVNGLAFRNIVRDDEHIPVRLV